MAELSGSLEGIGLVALVRFLTNIVRSGRLRIRDGELIGDLDLDNGSLVGASFEQERGMPALEAIALALGNARFEFRDLTEPVERNLRLSPEQVTERLEQLSHEHATLSAAVPSLSSVPVLVLDDDSDDRQVEMDRDTLRLLIRLDGKRTVSELARERGLLRTLRQLAQLVQLGLARMSDQPGASVRHAPAEPVETTPEEHPQREREPVRARPTSETTWSRWRRPPPHTPPP